MLFRSRNHHCCSGTLAHRQRATELDRLLYLPHFVGDASLRATQCVFGRSQCERGICSSSYGRVEKLPHGKADEYAFPALGDDRDHRRYLPRGSRGRCTQRLCTHELFASCRDYGARFGRALDARHSLLGAKTLELEPAALRA